MSFEQPSERVGLYPADIDMSNASVWQYAPVWLGPAQNTALYATSPGNAALVAQGALTDPPLGILQAPVVQGEPGTVVTKGISMCIALAPITRIGQPVTMAAGGCQPAVSGTGFVDGYAQETCATAGTIVAIKLEKGGKA